MDTKANTSESAEAAYTTFPGTIRHLAQRFGERECIALEADRLSFAEAEAASAHLATDLIASGVGKGTRVALLAPNGPDFVVGMLAAQAITLNKHIFTIAGAITGVHRDESRHLAARRGSHRTGRREAYREVQQGGAFAYPR